jgi:ubiquinol-cytochrome c reductase cytochrome b subunit
MARESSYIPGNGVTRWLDARLPLLRLIHDNFIAFPVPKNLNVWYVFGAILIVMLGLQTLTGLALAMHYVPSGSAAFVSVERTIMREVDQGWLLRGVHATGASLLFVAIYIHIARGLYYGSYKAPREMAWILGVVLFYLMIAAAFFGYALPWGQISYWATTAITNMFTTLDAAIPGLGTTLTTWLQGDYAVGDTTLTRLFVLHFTAAFAILGVVGLHIWSLHVAGPNNPLGIDVKSPSDTVTFHPRYTVKEGLAVVLFLMVFAGFVFYAPGFFLSPDNAIPANPLATPAEIKPEWYMLPFYAMLCAVPNALLGIVALFGSLATLLFLPWLDTSPVRSCRFRPVMRQLFWLLVADVALLGFIGAQPAASLWHIGGLDIPLTWLARLCTLYYFAFFWILMPWLGKKEVTLPMPGAIDEQPGEGR